MLKIIVPNGTSRKLDTITRPEVKMHLPAEKVTITVYNQSKTALVNITMLTTDSTIVVIQDPPTTEFKLDAIPDNLLTALREKEPWDIEGHCFYCWEADVQGLLSDHKPDCLWLRIQS